MLEVASVPCKSTNSPATTESVAHSRFSRLRRFWRGSRTARASRTGRDGYQSQLHLLEYDVWGRRSDVFRMSVRI